MIKLGGLIGLKPLNEADVFTATNKETGNVSVFKSKASRNAAVKSGSHEMRKDDKEDSVDVKGLDDKPKVNIFNKDKDQPKSDKSSEPDYDKYTNKSQTMTDFFKGDLSIDDLQKVAKKNFDSEIATEKDLDGFLNNKFMQDVMADEHGVDKDTLISKVKDLKKALFGGDKEEPKTPERKWVAYDKDHSMDSESGMIVPKGKESDNPDSKDIKGFDKLDQPKSEPQVKPRPADKVLTKTVDKFSKKLGLSPEKLGKEEYEKRMLSYVHDALEDANFHSANRQIFADLQGRPELAKRPDYSTAPDVGTPEREEWDMKNSIYNKNFDASVSEFDNSDEAVGALTSQASWEGEKIIDSLLDKLRKDGSGELADKIQISFDKDMAKNEGKLKLGDLV